MKIYLDTSCLNRPFDDQRQLRVRLEAEAVIYILEQIDNTHWKEISSEMVDIELAAIMDKGAWIGMKTLEQIRHEGLEALQIKLGRVGMIRFLQQFEIGRGDYSKERHAWVDQTTLQDILKIKRKSRRITIKRSSER